MVAEALAVLDLLYPHGMRTLGCRTADCVRTLAHLYL